MKCNEIPAFIATNLYFVLSLFKVIFLRFLLMHSYNWLCCFCSILTGAMRISKYVVRNTTIHDLVLSEEIDLLSHVWGSNVVLKLNYLFPSVLANAPYLLQMDLIRKPVLEVQTDP